MAEILDERKVEELKRFIEINGKIPVDNNLEQLQKYLELNPPGSEIKYLDN